MADHDHDTSLAPGFWGELLQPLAGAAASLSPFLGGLGGLGGLAAHVMSGAVGGAAGGAAQAAAPAGPESVVYLGLNDASREKEKGVFAGMPNATVVNGAGTDAAMQGKTMAADGETVLDLGNEADLQRFLRETGVGGVRRDAAGNDTETLEQAQARMRSMEDLFLGARNADGVREGGLPAGVRDEMAGFVQVLQGVETGQRTMDRLVMSGHSTGEWVYSEADGSPGVSFAQMAELMGQFPQAQAGVEDLMLSACHTLEDGAVMDNRDGAQYQTMLPNLDTVWGYDGYSPNYKQGSANHIRNWLKASDGDNAAGVAAMARRTGQNATVKTFP